MSSMEGPGLRSGSSVREIGLRVMKLGRNTGLVGVTSFRGLGLGVDSLVRAMGSKLVSRVRGAGPKLKSSYGAHPIVELEESLSSPAFTDWKERVNGEFVSDGKELSALRDGLRKFDNEILLLILRNVGEGEKRSLNEVLRSPDELVFGVVVTDLFGVPTTRGLHINISLAPSRARQQTHSLSSSVLKACATD